MSQQPDYKNTKHNNNKKNNRTKRGRKPMSNEKLKQKINKQLIKTDKDIKKKEAIVKINKVYGEKLQNLLQQVTKSSKESDMDLLQAFKKIQQDRKDGIKKLREEAKELKRKKKQESKLRRDLKNIEKETNKLQLDSSRIEEFPKTSNDLKFINLIIDGWNICGCDKIARKSMRGKRGSGAKRIIELMQLFRNSSDSCNDNVNITIHFDGNGKDLVLENDKILVKYSGKQEIVDDRLVRELGNNIRDTNNFKLNPNVKPYQISNNINPNRNYIVVTSDRELTLRLNKIGVTCMKSGGFYKQYLKPLAYGDDNSDDNNNDNNNNNNKKKDNDGDEEMVDKNKKEKVWKKYVTHKTFSDDSDDSSSSDSDF